MNQVNLDHTREMSRCQSEEGFSMWIVLCELVDVNLMMWISRSELTMCESSILICMICPIRKYSWYSHLRMGWITRSIRSVIRSIRSATPWFALKISRTNQANRTNFYSLIYYICLIRPANRWLICSIRSIRNRSRFNLFDSLASIRPIRLDLMIRSASFPDLRIVNVNQYMYMRISRCESHEVNPDHSIEVNQVDVNTPHPMF